MMVTTSLGNTSKSCTTLRDTQPGMVIRMVPKLKYEHVAIPDLVLQNASSSGCPSKLEIVLITHGVHVHVCHPQVLSESVSKAFQLVVGVEAAETSKFVGMIDNFFDILNVHNYTHRVHTRKPFQMPYTTS